jgi:amidase
VGDVQGGSFETRPHHGFQEEIGETVMNKQDDRPPEALAAHALATRIRRRELTAVEALDAALARIEVRNPDLNAVVALDAEGARRAAAAADAKLDGGADVGRLHGVPIAIKDGHDVAGLRTTIGTEVFDRVAEKDGTVAARLRAAGAVIVGHTNVPPLLADYQVADPIYGRTNNPWHLDRTPGGSSGGAAAAVAAGLTPFDVGSDLTGSLRGKSGRHGCISGTAATNEAVNKLKGLVAD